MEKMGSTEKLCLQWDNFVTNVSAAFCDMKKENDFSDVTLVCADEQVEVLTMNMIVSLSCFC